MIDDACSQRKFVVDHSIRDIDAAASNYLVQDRAVQRIDFSATANISKAHSTQRNRVLSPGEVANIPGGKALHLDGVRWELVTLTAVHAGANSPFEAAGHVF